MTDLRRNVTAAKTGRFPYKKCGDAKHRVSTDNFYTAHGVILCDDIVETWHATSLQYHNFSPRMV
jgi:hypothetical protein